MRKTQRRKKTREAGFGKWAVITICLIVIAALVFLSTHRLADFGPPDQQTVSSTAKGNIFPPVEYKDFVAKYSDEYPRLLIKNKGQYVSDFQAFIPIVVEENTDYVRVYSDMAQTVINIPRGWFGLDTSSGEGVFTDPEDTMILRLGFTEVGREIRTMEDLQQYATKSLEAIKSQPSFSKLESSTITQLNNHQLMITLNVSPGRSWIVYELNYQKPQFLSKIQFTVRSNPTEKHFGLLGLFLKDHEIIGIHEGDRPDAREQFIKTLPEFDPCYGMTKLGVGCKSTPR